MSVAALTLQAQPAGRETRDRLELLTALINGPSFDPLFRGDVIQIPADHPAYPWCCTVTGCQRPRWHKRDLCPEHDRQWQSAKESGVSRSRFVHAAQPLALLETLEPVVCRICPQRPAFNRALRLCRRHRNRWVAYRKTHGEAADFEGWQATQTVCESYGECLVRACDELADSPLGLCVLHGDRYRRDGKPGGAALPKKWFNVYEKVGRISPVAYRDESLFRRWCRAQPPIMRLGQINLRGLRPLAQAEIRWGLHAHAQKQHARVWNLPWIQSLVRTCHQRDVHSLTELAPAECGPCPRVIVQEIRDGLKLVYYSPADTREAGYFDTEHFGVRFPQRGSSIDLTGVSQRWLRDLLWDHLADQLRSPACPRTAHGLDFARRACLELSALLEIAAPGGGHDPTTLRAEHMHRFVAELRHRERHGLPFLAVHRLDGRSTKISENARRSVFNYGRKILRTALETGEAQRLGLDRGFITALPVGGATTKRSRSPFPDDVARALADEQNLRMLAEVHDAHDRGLRDMWEAIVFTGRRAGEIINLRFDCLGHYHGLPMLWHDQTKVGNYDMAIRIPERLHQVLTERQTKTLAWFADRHAGRRPTARERAALALFPTDNLNIDGQRAMSYTWFQTGFKAWIEDLDLGHHVVAHQARHTLATRLLRHGATLSHIRRYLGHVSDRMAEHYAKVAVSEIEDVLQHVWVAGPGAANPGELLSGGVTPMNRLQAEALALDLSRRSTPTEGGFCTFQPVVDGGSCPWKLNCENCDKFVLSGADLLYWRRKREQWRSIAERAPDDATADYLHQVFEPTAKAIDGLEKALAGLGLLDEALALDLRRPQDYFQRLWNLGFRASDLATAAENTDDAGWEEPA